jgi:uncharacterized protein (TIGR01777 family)
MKIVIPGGSGQVGTLLARAFTRDGHEVVVLSRKIHPADWKVVGWDAETIGLWSDEIDGADIVINLAGRHVNCRYTPENREEIMDSRVNSTRVVGEAIANSKNPPRLWLQMSTATIYAHRYDSPNDEITGIIGGDEPGAPKKWNFSIDVVKAWEKAANDAITPNTRKVLMRLSILMSPERGDTFDMLLGLVKKGLGGTNGDGRQFVSWIHDIDFIRAVNWLIDHEELSGPINLASPLPIPNKDFMRILRDSWGASFGIPSPKWLLEIAAYFMRTETELVLKSRRVVPKILTDSGFQFEFPLWDQAAQDLCRRWRHQNQSA